MSILSKLGLKRARTEASKQLWGEDVTRSKNAPPTFVPELITGCMWNVNDLNHLEKVATMDPVANYITYKIADNVFDDWFKFVDKDGKEIMLDVQKELRLLGAHKILPQALGMERTFGYSYIYTGKNRRIPKTREGGRIATIHAFSPLECVVYEYDEVGRPKTMELTVSRGVGQYTAIDEKITLPSEDFIYMNTRPIGRSEKGRSSLLNVWDMLTYLRYETHSMSFYDTKIGLGVFTAYINGEVSEAMQSRIDSIAEDISIKRMLSFDKEVIDELKFVGPDSNATDFVEHIYAILKLIAAGTGIPYEILIGATAGAITGSETNIKALYEVLHQIQRSVEEYIRDLIKRMGYTRDDYYIEWNVQFAHDEEEQSKIAMNKAQTLAIRSQWLTINEIRSEEGLPPIEGGDDLKADFQVNVEGFQGHEEREQTRNPDGEQL